MIGSKGVHKVTIVQLCIHVFVAQACDFCCVISKAMSHEK